MYSSNLFPQQGQAQNKFKSPEEVAAGLNSDGTLDSLGGAVVQNGKVMVGNPGAVTSMVQQLQSSGSSTTDPFWRSLIDKSSQM